jgi:hypothetical protein
MLHWLLRTQVLAGSGCCWSMFLDHLQCCAV